MAEFIDITEPRSPLGTENILRPYKRGEAEITVDVCMGVLRGTNFARSIRDMLGCVKKNSARENAGIPRDYLIRILRAGTA